MDPIVTGVVLTGAHILAFCVSTYILLLERKYCKHLDWWSDIGALIIFIFNLIPVIGLLTSIVGYFDCTRNIIEELDENRQCE